MSGMSGKKYENKGIRKNALRITGGILCFPPNKNCWQRRCDFGVFAPARAAVNPRLREAAGTLAATRGELILMLVVVCIQQQKDKRLTSNTDSK